MAKRQKPIVGLDIDPAGIAVARVAVSDGTRLDHAFTAALEPGIVRDGEVIDVPALSEILRHAWSQHKGLDRRVRIGVANQKVVVRTIELPVGAEGKELDGPSASRRRTRSRCRSTRRSWTGSASRSRRPRTVSASAS
jgi:type IV pilus assembly protein PilM